MENPIKPQETKKPKGKKQYKEADIVLLFKLKRIATYQTPLMKEWLAAETPVLDIFDQRLFDKKLEEAQTNIIGWSEEDLKMKFISVIIELGRLTSGGNIVTFFDKTVSATVKGIKLTVKSDFMIAKGLWDVSPRLISTFRNTSRTKHLPATLWGSFWRRF